MLHCLNTVLCLRWLGPWFMATLYLLQRNYIWLFDEQVIADVLFCLSSGLSSYSCLVLCFFSLGLLSFIMRSAFRVLVILAILFPGMSLVLSFQFRILCYNRSFDCVDNINHHSVYSYDPHPCFEVLASPCSCCQVPGWAPWNGWQQFHDDLRNSAICQYFLCFLVCCALHIFHPLQSTLNDVFKPDSKRHFWSLVVVSSSTTCRPGSGQDELSTSKTKSPFAWRRYADQCLMLCRVSGFLMNKSLRASRLIIIIAPVFISDITTPAISGVT